MRFSFSSKFRQNHYQALLKELGEEVDCFRLFCGCTVKKMMADIHISYPVLKKY